MQHNTIELLPDFLREIRELKALHTSYDAEFDLIDSAANKLLINFFFDDLDADGCTRWEEMLDLKVGDDDTLDERRLRIKALYLGDTPYTERLFTAMLENIAGVGKAEIKVDIEQYKVDIKIALGSKKQFEEIKALAERVVPLNMGLSVELIYNTYGGLSDYTHGFLGNYTHIYIKENVLMKGDDN